MGFHISVQQSQHSDPEWSVFSIFSYPRRRGAKRIAKVTIVIGLTASALKRPPLNPTVGRRMVHNNTHLQPIPSKITQRPFADSMSLHESRCGRWRRLHDGEATVHRRCWSGSCTTTCETPTSKPRIPQRRSISTKLRLVGMNMVANLCFCCAVARRW